MKDKKEHSRDATVKADGMVSCEGGDIINDQ